MYESVPDGFWLVVELIGWDGVEWMWYDGSLAGRIMNS